MRDRRTFLAGATAGIIAAFSTGSAMGELRHDVKVIPSKRGFTFLVELGNAPFPVGPEAVDHRGRPFWHGREPATGQRFRFLGDGRRYLENAAYNDPSVLFHVPRSFDPAKPFHLVVFLHGHDSSVERTLVRQYDLPGQIERAGVNALLIAPQLSRDARDSAAGRFVEPGRAADFIDEAEQLLHSFVNIDYSKLRRAPIVLAAYSGGYRTLAQILLHGELDARIEGVVLLDAVYADTEIYADWIAKHDQRSFVYVLYSPSSQTETARLRSMLRLRNVPMVDDDDGGGGAINGVRFVRTGTPHDEIPVAGPPREPLGTLLKRIVP